MEMTPLDKIKAEPWKSPRLIQRLNAPTGRVNPFSFGGGFRNGGISDEAANAFAQMFSFDYMGAAEFEFGALPESCNRMFVLRENYVYDSLEVHSPEQPEGETRTVYYACLKEHESSLKSFLPRLAINEYDTGRWVNEDSICLKESSNFRRALEPDSPYSTKGWWDFDNSAVWTIDGEMFEKVKLALTSAEEKDTA